MYLRELETGPPRALTPPGVTSEGEPISPDRQFVAADDPAGKLSLYPVAGGEPRSVPGAAPYDFVFAWSSDGRVIWVSRLAGMPGRIYHLELASGRRTLWKELRPTEPAGVTNIDAVRMAPDAKAYAYSYMRRLSDLYVVEGLK